MTGVQTCALPISDEATKAFNSNLVHKWSEPSKMTKEKSGRSSGVLPFGIVDLGQIDGDQPSLWQNGKFEYVTQRDPYATYDDPWDRRNFGDPLHEEDDIIGSFAPTMYNEETTGKSNYYYFKNLFGSLAAIYGIYWIFSQHKYIRGFYGIDAPIMSKMYAKSSNGLYNVKLDGVEYAKKILEVE